MDKFDWECWNHYGTEQKFRKIGNKLDEIVDWINRVKKEQVIYEIIGKEK